jgi:Glycosyltransferase WbsX
MKYRKSQFILFFFFLGILISVNEVNGQNKKNNGTFQPRTNYDIAAFVWPSYHPDDRAKIFWPMGIGEWETVMKNKAMFEGHQQPRYPLWGYINEADPYVAEMEINAAADHGVNVFIFDWYWYDGMPYLEGHLNEGYLKARNNSRMKFYLMWANHDVNLTWDKRNAGLPNNSLIWKGGVDRNEFEVICHRVIEKYFSHPSYYTIDGKPSFMIYELQTLIQGLGGLEQTLDALAWFRRETQKAGFKGLDLQVTLRRSGSDMTGIDGENIGTQFDMLEQFGFDGLTHYQFVHFADIDRDYMEIMDDVLKEWSALENENTAPYYPHISVGWDNNPRFENFRKGIVLNNTPENFEKALVMAKNYTDAHPDQAPLITINRWNEWTETSYLQPCTLYGYGYLEAIKRVFVDSTKSR